MDGLVVPIAAAPAGLPDSNENAKKSNAPCGSATGETIAQSGISAIVCRRARRCAAAVPDANCVGGSRLSPAKSLAARLTVNSKERVRLHLFNPIVGTAFASLRQPLGWGSASNSNPREFVCRNSKPRRNEEHEEQGECRYAARYFDHCFLFFAFFVSSWLPMELLRRA